MCVVGEMSAEQTDINKSSCFLFVIAVLSLVLSNCQYETTCLPLVHHYSESACFITTVITWYRVNVKY